MDATIDLLVVRDVGVGFFVATIGEITEGDAESSVPFLEIAKFDYGKTFPDDYGDDGFGLNRLESTLGFLAFLNSPYIPKQKRRLLRPERREISRLSGDDLGEEVTFITLRRPEPPPNKQSDGDGGSEWHHQWLVSGHYRAQWYPSESAHHVIWIAPHLKGPADAPLLEHAYRVAR